jgi:anti-sigma regulatory factor (Ser/Thr protein kinase)
MADESPPIEHRTQLPRTSGAASMARAALAEWFGTDLEEPLLARAQLLASELVTNAYVHGQGTIEMRAALDVDRLLVEVTDEGSGFEREVSDRSLDAVGGRGLKIVEADASSWGIHEGTTHVWFELERPGPRLGEEAKPDI